MKARRFSKLGFEDLQKMGVVLKRALYFITCGGRMMYPTRMDEDYILRNLLSEKERKPLDIDGYRQLTLFDDFNVPAQPGRADAVKCLTGQM